MEVEDLEPCEKYVNKILEQEIKIFDGDSTKVFLGGFG
jgi:hypothetical protein